MSKTSHIWEKHIDQAYNAPYWFNRLTGESTWVEPINWAATAALLAPEKSQVPNQPDREKKKTKKSIKQTKSQQVKLSDVDNNLLSNGNKEYAVDDSTDIPLLAQYSDSKLTLSPHAPIGKDHNSKSHTSIGADGSFTDIERVSMLLQAERTYADTAADIDKYERSVYYTACIIEGPLAILEACIRAAVFATAACLCIFLSAATLIVTPAKSFTSKVSTTPAQLLHERTSENDQQNGILQRKLYIIWAIACGKESLLCIAAALALLIPGMACLVYRNQPRSAALSAIHESEEAELWELAPIPTLIGWVDTRRFAVFAFGGGRFAARRHVRANKMLESDQDRGVVRDLEEEDDDERYDHHEMEQEVSAPTTVDKIIPQVQRRLQDLHLSQSLSYDSWGGQPTATTSSSACYKRYCAFLDRCRNIYIVVINSALCVGVTDNRELVSENSSIPIAVRLYTIGISYGIPFLPRKLYRRIQEILRGHTERALSRAVQIEQEELDKANLKAFQSMQQRV